MKEILIITNYYPPETGAASNRINHLAEELADHNFSIKVLTPLPNYPTGKIFKSYRGKFSNPELISNVSVYRLWVYASNSKNTFLRLVAMLSYSFSLVRFFIKNKLPNTIIIQSPPLVVAFVSILFLRSKKRRLILNVSDLWPLAGLELGAFKKNYSYKLLEKLERFNYRNADLVLGQSDEIRHHITSIFPNKETFLYRNYPKIKPIPIAKSKENNPRLKIVYAGLLGVAQGIYNLIQNLEITDFEFHIYGDGAERKLITAYIEAHPEKFIFYHGELPREALHNELQSYDVALIPLLKRIYGSVPSKIFEFAHLGLPLLYFGGGEGELIIEKHNLGWVAKVGNYNSLNSKIREIKKEAITKEYRIQIQETALNNFDFSSQLIRLIDKINRLSLLL